SWTPAINMGGAINTPENEITAYYSSAFSCMLYASNGHVGYGGYDLFAAKGESFFEPEIYNLGYPFNSTRDDTYFNVSDSVGYLASNRVDGKILNLYYFDVKDEALFLSLLISGEKLIDSQIVSRFRDIRSLDLSAFRVEDYQGYDLFDPEKRSKPKPSRLLASTESKEQDETLASAVRPSNTSIDGIENVAGFSDDSRTAYQLAYEKIYFEFGSSKLSSGGVASAENLINQLSTNNFQTIDILAYTDQLGPSDFNMKLSEDRGQSVKEQLVSLGISESRIRVLPRGEIPPQGGKNNWYSRLFSRRVEIIVNTDYDLRFNAAKTYVIRQNHTPERVAELVGVSLPVFQQWNNFKGDMLRAGTAIRVFNPKGRSPSIRHFLDEQDIKNSFFLYRVQSGETLASIAEKYKTIEELLREVNNLDRNLRAGEQIYVYRLK
ncbi:MAG: LysM peptidoglycan-binding domain-containing protein, partial [Cytophagales bacterium]|nr:LysM peptidoglycan-binding domain-containing protein [Cytophagales bacterium]